MSEELEKRFERRQPDGDTHERDICARCGFIAYENPKIVVGTVVTHEDRFLLCRRAIEPRKGFWTVPAGYLELQETPEEGARREAFEEASAELQIGGLLAVYSVRHLSQVQLIFHGDLVDGAHEPGIESLETALFKWHDIPWNELAFPTVHWMLGHEAERRSGATGLPFGNPQGEGVQK
ncbi:NUDIX domain-containing protein [Oricola sp.]|uniref:NUDIX hydrolase n=1 Tax=Oricola sp. TaxID=1979950 RepID=UPI003BA85041